MTLENWYNNKWLKQEKSSKAEINTLCLKIERDIKDSHNKEISLDWRLAMAYSALLSCATIALRIFEYRISEGANSHYYSIQSLKFTMKIPHEEISFLDSIRKKDIWYLTILLELHLKKRLKKLYNLPRIYIKKLKIG